MEDTPDLKNNWIDHLTSTLKVIAGAVPFTGGIVAELLSSVIPLQRIDRIVGFMEILSKKLEALDQKFVRAQLTSPDGTSLLEESFLIAYRARSDERRHQIASVVASGISGPKIKVAESQRLLSLLGELNDAEAIILQSYAYGFKHYPFSRIHHDLLYPEIPALADPPHVRDSYAMRQSYDDHLDQLGLIESELGIKQSSRGKSEVVEKGRKITRVGIALVRSMGGEVVEYSRTTPSDVPK